MLYKIVNNANRLLCQELKYPSTFLLSIDIVIFGYSY